MKKCFYKSYCIFLIVKVEGNAVFKMVSNRTTFVRFIMRLRYYHKAYNCHKNIRHQIRKSRTRRLKELTYGTQKLVVKIQRDMTL